MKGWIGRLSLALKASSDKLIIPRGGLLTLLLNPRDSNLKIVGILYRMRIRFKFSTPNLDLIMEGVKEGATPCPSLAPIGASLEEEDDSKE